MITVQKIAPSLAQHFVDSDDLEITEAKHRHAFDLSKLGLYSRYLNRLHDSNVLEAEAKGGNFVLTLNDFVSHVFACTLIKQKCIDIAREDLVFPVRLEFKAAMVTFNVVNSSGVLYQIDEVQFDEYIDEEILAVTDSFIEIALVVWKDAIENEPGKYLLILIKTTGINVVESQDAAWKAFFDERFDRYYEYLKAQLAKNRYCADQTICNQLIYELEGLAE